MVTIVIFMSVEYRFGNLIFFMIYLRNIFDLKVYLKVLQMMKGMKFHLRYYMIFLSNYAFTGIENTGNIHECLMCISFTSFVIP